MVRNLGAKMVDLKDTHKKRRQQTQSDFRYFKNQQLESFTTTTLLVI